MHTDTAPTTRPNIRDALLSGTCTFVELMEALGYSERKLEKLIVSGLPVIRIGRDRRFDIQKTRAWLMTRERHAA